MILANAGKQRWDRIGGDSPFLNGALLNRSTFVARSGTAERQSVRRFLT